MAGWKVWGELRNRPHIELVFATLPFVDGLVQRLADGRRVITLADDLTQAGRRATLAHELVHEERDIFYDDDTPIALIEREERWVEDEAVRRLVPPEELADHVRRRVFGGGTVEWRDVADWFDVPHDVAERALRQLEQEVRRRHPSGH